MKFFGSRLFVAILSSVITAIGCTVTFASAATPTHLNGSIYSQTCTFSGTVWTNGKTLHQPMGHVGQDHNGHLRCDYP